MRVDASECCCKAGAMSLCHEKASGLTGKAGVKENQ
jgi:hypothetical protein